LIGARYEDMINMKKCSWKYELFDGRTFRSIRTHPEELFATFDEIHLFIPGSQASHLWVFQSWVKLCVFYVTMHWLWSHLFSHPDSVKYPLGVQNSSKFNQDSNGRTFRYEFLQELILEELFEHVSYVKNGKMSIFLQWVLR